MGKGGTKFEGDAIGVRGKAKAGLTGKEMRRNMVRGAPLHTARRRPHGLASPAGYLSRCARTPSFPSNPSPRPTIFSSNLSQSPRPQEIFLETGVHPELERQAAAAAAEGPGGQITLPDHDQHRPFVFWDITIDNKPAGARGAYVLVLLCVLWGGGGGGVKAGACCVLCL